MAMLFQLGGSGIDAHASSRRPVLVVGALVLLHLLAVWCVWSSRGAVMRVHAPASVRLRFFTEARKPVARPMEKTAVQVSHLKHRASAAPAARDLPTLPQAVEAVAGTAAVVEPASGSAAVPTFDMEQARALARQQAHRTAASGAALSGEDSAVARSFEKARRADCRTRYAKNGVLAVLPLLASALHDQGCKW